MSGQPFLTQAAHTFGVGTKYGMNEVVCEGLIALANGEQGRLQMNITSDSGDKELGLYVEEKRDNGDVVVIMQSK